MAALMVGFGAGPCSYSTARAEGLEGITTTEETPYSALAIYEGLEPNQTVRVRMFSTITRLDDALSVHTKGFELIDIGADGSLDMVVGEGTIDSDKAYHRVLKSYSK